MWVDRGIPRGCKVVERKSQSHEVRLLPSHLWANILASFNINLTQVNVILEENTSIKKMTGLVRWLSGLEHPTALLKVQSSIPSNHMVAHNHP